MDHPFPEDCVARFRPERQLASGGFGTVWLGTHIQLGRKVALKVLLARFHAFDPEDLSADADIVAAWLLLRTIEANTMDTGTPEARSTKEGIGKQTQRIAHVRRVEGRMSPLFHAVARTLGLLQW